MAAAAQINQTGAPHIPVLLSEVLDATEAVAGKTVIDGTFGAGGYSRALLDAGAGQVIGIDRDPTALAAADWAVAEPRLILVEGVFSDLEAIAQDHASAPVVAIVLDIGVSSMQLDQGERGFSFLRDGPLDMRMSGQGRSAADLVNDLPQEALADIIFRLGEDRASRRIARAIVAARKDAPIDRMLHLAEIVAGCLPRPKPGQPHPATRTFQALRIAVNDELGELVQALIAAERVLVPGGRLVVVTFHSLEDRIVKRFFQTGSMVRGTGSRHGPEREMPPPRWQRPAKAVAPSAEEIEANPRARSARLRMGVRTDAATVPVDPTNLGLPTMTPDSATARRARR
ncbi:MAG: 16S rRNA (cytosine(1402)-N(4))-methyltransferase RsmH [Pseudomonadota bacterium]